MSVHRSAVAVLAAMVIAIAAQTATSRSHDVAAGSPAAGTITTYAGASINSAAATTIPMQPQGVAVYGSTLYITDSSAGVLRTVDLTTGQTSSVGPFSGPVAVAVDASTGDVYVIAADKVWVEVSGAISLYATGFVSATGLAVDASGNVYVADSGSNQIVRIDPTTKALTAVAGNGTAGFSGDGGPATAAELSAPQGIAFDPSGNLWIVDTYNYRLREVSAGNISTIAGTPSSTPGCATGPALTTGFIVPAGVAVDGAGNVFVSDSGDNCIYELTGSTLTAIAGTGTVGYSGDGGPATLATLAYPKGITFDSAGNVYFADSLTYRVRRVTSGGIISTFAGTGFLPPSTCALNGDGDQATSIILCAIAGIAVDASGDVFFSDSLMNVVREITTSGLLKTVAGNGSGGHAGDNGPATAAGLDCPGPLAFDNAGDLLIGEKCLDYPALSSDTIRLVDTSGDIHTVAGGGSPKAGTTPTPALSASIVFPTALAPAPDGGFYIADYDNAMVEKVTPGGSFTTDTIARVAGGGTNFPGDGGPATQAAVYPTGVAVDGSGNLYIASPGGNRLQKVDLGGIISTVATFDNTGGDPGAVEIAPTGQVVVTSGGRLEAVTPSGIDPVAGNGSLTLSGDGGPAYQAGMNPGAFAFDAAGDLFLSDLQTTPRVRRIEAFAAPSAPLSVTATPSMHSATVHWSAPAMNGGAPVTEYTVRSYQGVNPGPSVVTPGMTALLGGLAANVPYTFTVTASNSFYTGPASAASDPVTPAVLTSNGDILTYAGTIGSGPSSKIGQFPYSLAVTGTHLYVGDFANPVIRDVDITNKNEGVLAGNDSYGYSGDGGPASAAMIQGAGAMAECGGQLYIADTFNFVIRKIDAGGAITRFAGTGLFGFGGDGGPATAATFGRVFGLACRAAGGLYVSDSDNGAVRIIDGSGKISTWWSGFSFPTGITELSPNVVDVSDSAPDNAVWHLTSKTAALVAGLPGYPGYSGDGGQAGNGNSQLNDPRGLAFIGGSLYIADRGNNAVRVINGQGTISTTPIGTSSPAGLAADPANNFLYVASSGDFKAVQFNLANNGWTDVAGNGTPSYSGDGGPAAQAQLGNPFAVALDANDNLYIADNQNVVIRKVDPTGQITTVAGNGTPGYSGDGGPATAAELSDPRGVAVAPNGDVYFSDNANQRVRKVDHSTGVITTVATGLVSPEALAVDANGTLFIADTQANIVYRLESNGALTDIAGTGTAGFSGDDGPASAADLNLPRGLAFDSAGNLFIGDSDNNRVRRVDQATGIITTVAGNGTAGMSGDGSPATSAEINHPFGVAVDSAGRIFIADAVNDRVRVVDPLGTISTVVATCGAAPGFSGDGGPAAVAHVNLPFGIAVDAFGDLFIADINSNRVRATTGLVAGRGGSCPGPAGTPGSRGATSSLLSPAALLLPRSPGKVAALRQLGDRSAPSTGVPHAKVHPTRVSSGPVASGGSTPAGSAGAPRNAPPSNAPSTATAPGHRFGRGLMARATVPGGAAPWWLAAVPLAAVPPLLIGVRKRRKRVRAR